MGSFTQECFAGQAFAPRNPGPSRISPATPSHRPGKPRAGDQAAAFALIPRALLLPSRVRGADKADVLFAGAQPAPKALCGRPDSQRVAKRLASPLRCAFRLWRVGRINGERLQPHRSFAKITRSSEARAVSPIDLISKSSERSYPSQTQVPSFLTACSVILTNSDRLV